MSHTVVTIRIGRALAAVALGLLGCGTNVVEPIGAELRSHELVAHWKLDEMSSTDAALDSVGDHTAAPVNAPASSRDVPSVIFTDRASRSFDGQTQYLRIPTSDDLNFSGEITLAAWVNVAALGADCQYVVGHGYCTSPPGEVVLRIGVPGCGPSADAHYWAVGAWLSGEYSAAAPFLDSDLGVWVHMAGTYVNAEQAWHLYRNGQEIATQSSPVGAIPVQNDWSIGARAPGLPPCMPEGPERYFNGSIDDVRIYRRALSAAEIEELYHL
jgi:hypothetical protein